MDPYVEYDTLTLLLDLILLKQGVYRHLLYNRGSKPRRATSKFHDIDTAYLSRARWIWTIKLGAGLVVLDACMFSKYFRYCWLTFKSFDGRIFVRRLTFPSLSQKLIVV